MIYWVWAVLAFFAGTFFGIFLLALLDGTRSHDDEGRWGR